MIEGKENRDIGLAGQNGEECIEEALRRERGYIARCGRPKEIEQGRILLRNVNTAKRLLFEIL